MESTFCGINKNDNIRAMLKKTDCEETNKFWTKILFIKSSKI